MPSRGAEEVVHFCGGLCKLLQAAGINVPPQESATEVCFDSSEYERLRSILGNERKLGIQLLERESSIPDATLAAFRYVSQVLPLADDSCTPHI